MSGRRVQPDGQTGGGGGLGGAAGEGVVTLGEDIGVGLTELGDASGVGLVTTPELDAFPHAAPNDKAVSSTTTEVATPLVLALVMATCNYLPRSKGCARAGTASRAESPPGPRPCVGAARAWCPTPDNTPPYARHATLEPTALSANYRGGRWLESTAAHQIVQNRVQ